MAVVIKIKVYECEKCRNVEERRATVYFTKCPSCGGHMKVISQREENK